MIITSKNISYMDKKIDCRLDPSRSRQHPYRSIRLVARTKPDTHTDPTEPQF